ncbi:CaiB/BaiF CoA transferase family protein [Phenylobacterium sp. VNQ135]|uniref:CaiB/BaiF CoA transferase family protein n=1 Tax=Phenylobacterium sp. VNQ135 TaxID=3400922 RepID=UPI003BFA814D
MSLETLPLHGVRVLDLGAVLMAPYAAQWLADFGAEVIKVEPPAGDTTRRIGPRAEPDMASVFLGANRNKKSIVLDLKTDAGREALLALVDGADVLMHNNRPQKMRALGLDPETLRARSPRLVYACLHGFGETGPYGGRPAYDDIIQGMCGLADLQGQRSGAPGYLPTSAADKTAGMAGAIAILAAVVRQQRDGVGAYVEVPMFENLVAYTAVEHLYGRHFDPPKGPAAYPRVMTAERRPFATADGHICVLPYTDQHWKSFFEAAGRPEVADDPRFDGVGPRTENIEALYAIVSEILVTRTTAEWSQILQRLEVPNGPVKSLDDLIADPHLEAVGLFETLPQADGSTLRMTGVPVLIDGERPPVRMPPRLGEHTREILLAAGLSPQQVEALT